MTQDTSPIKSRKHGTILRILERTYDRLPSKLKPRSELIFSFKNRILFSTLAILTGGIITIAAVLQMFVIPQLQQDSKTVISLKLIHLVASLLVIGIIWIFVEIISKKITHPLLELTKRADEISREVGIALSADSGGQNSSGQALRANDDPTVRGDEIDRLTVSFNRMLASINTSETLLRESEEKYRFLFDHGPIPKFVVDADDMTILDVNKRAEYQYQYSREEMIGKSFTELAAPPETRLTDPLLKIFAQSNLSPMPILRHVRRDGSTLLVNMEARLSGLKDKPALIIAVWDVTEKLEQQAQLLQAGKMATLGEMATGLAHELNQPLNVIKIGSDFVLKNIRRGRGISDEELRKTAEEVGANVDRATSIIAHLRQFGFKSEDSMSPVSISKPIKGVFTMLGTQLTKRGIKWEVDVEDSLPPIMGDANRLEQVFINLILNARDAMLDLEKQSREVGKTMEKVLTVKAYSERGHVVVTVSDTGPGIPPLLRQKIFEPFFTTKTVGEGTGIGLSISYSIVKEHRGSIEVLGNGEGGATFQLTFPALDESIDKAKRGLS